MPTSDDTSGDSSTPSDPRISAASGDDTPSARDGRAGTTVPFSALAAPTVVHASKLSPEAIAHCDLREVEYVVIEPVRDGWRLRPAEIEDQLKHEQEGGLGRVTYSLGEFLDEFTNAPSNPAPTFDRLAQFKRDYAKLTPSQRERFRAAVKKFVAPFSTTPPGDFGEPLVRELTEHPGYYELRFAADTSAIYTFGQAIRRGQPHVVWCRIGTDAALDQPPIVCSPIG